LAIFEAEQMTNLSQKILELRDSETLAMAARSRALAAQGYSVINLSLGEPDFPTPLHIQEAAHEAIRNNFTFYTPVAGYAETRKAVSEKLLRDNQLEYSPEQIVCSTGAKQSIINLLLCLLNPGDEVLLPAPYWVSYLSMIEWASGIPVVLPSGVGQSYKIRPEQLEAAITPKTKAFLFSSPCNPTGSVYTAAELEDLARVFRKYPDIVVISDEIYEYINFLPQHDSILHCAGMQERGVIINGLSKGFSMTGWRFGYLAASQEIATACVKLQGQFTSATCSITQRAAIAALTGDLTPTHEMRDAFRSRRDVALERLLSIDGIRCNRPDGAFYLFPDISHYLGHTFNGQTIQDAGALCDYLLNEAHVALVAGDAFGAPGCLRMSYATGEDRIKEAMDRIERALLALES
jgi:aspartate aminotransferase